MANLRVKKKHLDENSVDGTKIKLSSNQPLRGLDKDSTEVEILKLDSQNKLIGYGYELARKVDVESEASARAAADLVEKTERMAADASEASAREAGDAAEASARQAADLAEKTERMAADAAEATARQAGDEAVKTELRGGASSAYDTLKKVEDKIEFIASNLDPESLDSLTEIVEAFQAADNNINNAITSLANSASVGLEQEKTERMAADAAEASARQAADASEQSAREAADLVEKTERMAADAAEATAREAADSDLDARLVIIEGNSTVEGSVAKAEADAKAYTDEKIAELVDSAPVVLDTLKELADALNNDGNFAVTISNRFSAIESSISSAADASSDYTDTKFDEIMDLLSTTLLKRETIVLSSQDVSRGYVVLTGASIINNSVAAFIDRLSIFEGEDFSVSSVSGETRLTFLNSYASSGLEAVEANDELRVSYWRFV